MTRFQVCYITRSMTPGLWRVLLSGDDGSQMTIDGLLRHQVSEFQKFDSLGQPHPATTRFELVQATD